jgi:hypothetical protein
MMNDFFQSLMKGDQGLPGDSMMSFLSDPSSAGGGALRDLVSTGSPVMNDPAYQARKAQVMRDIGQSAGDIKESFGASGVGGGTDLVRALGFARSNALNEFGTSEMGLQGQFLESAANRRLSAGGLLTDLASKMDARSLGKFGIYGPLMASFISSMQEQNSRGTTRGRQRGAGGSL